MTSAPLWPPGPERRYYECRAGHTPRQLARQREELFAFLGEFAPWYRPL